jgi:ribosomal protein L22
MTAEEDKDEATPAQTPEAKKPAAKKTAAKKPAKAAAAAKGADAKADDAKAAERKKPAAKKAAKKAAAKKEPVASEKKAPAKEAAKPARRRVVRAHARYVRTSARKARMVCGHLRGKSVQEARAILAFTPREVARDWSKLLESAVANAESNHELLEEDLVVREAYADEGPTIKRFRPRAMGRATPIRKRTSHLTIALTADAVQRTTKRKG